MTTIAIAIAIAARHVATTDLATMSTSEQCDEQVQGGDSRRVEEGLGGSR